VLVSTATKKNAAFKSGFFVPEGNLQLDFFLEPAKSTPYTRRVGSVRPIKANRLPGGFFMSVIFPFWSSYENSTSVGDEALEVLI